MLRSFNRLLFTAIRAPQRAEFGPAEMPRDFQMPPTILKEFGPEERKATNLDECEQKLGI